MRGNVPACQRIAGEFTVTTATYDAVGRLQTFAAEFEQHCEGLREALRGTVEFRVGDAAPPAPWMIPRTTPPPPPDSDGDGVVDEGDRCPDKPASTPDGCSNRSPIAAFDYAPKSPRAGDNVEFDASRSRDPDPGGLVRFRWDLDSDGAFEREGGTLPTGVSRTFEEPGRFAVRVEVTDVEGCTASVHRMVDVLPPDGDGDGVADPEDDCPDEPATNPDGCPNEAPTAAFEFAPSNPRTGQRVAFDASASRDPDPDDVLHFRWDLDGDGLFENDGGESPTGVGRAFDVGGVYRVGLEVTDRRGRSSLLVREVRVEEPPYVGDSAASEGASNPPSPPRPAPEPAPALITAPPGLPPTPLPTATSSTAKAVAACKRLRSRARRSLCLKRARAAAACRKVQNRRKRTLCLRRARAIR